MKRIMSFLIVLLGVLFINTKPVMASLTLNYSTVKLGVNKSINLTVSGGNNNLTWATSDENIAAVDNGTVRGGSVGTAYISVTDGTYSAICTVNVIENYVAVSSISVSPSSINLSPSEGKQLNVTISPSNASNNNVIYSSDNSAVASVDSNGYIKALSGGTAHIIVTAENKSTTVTVSVISNVSLKGITAPSELSITEGEKSKIVVTYNPTNATNKTVSFKSSNTGVATVDSSGLVTAVSSGEATITIISSEGNYVATTKVKVAALDKTLKGISLDKNTMTIKPGETATLTVKFDPENAENKKVKWSSSDKNIATVEDGTITAIKPGMVEIKVKSDEGNYEAICKVTVSSEPIESISFAKEKYSVYVGESITLETISVPEYSFIEDVMWVTTDPNVATVANGIVTGVNPGTVMITISDTEGKITANTTVNVIKKNEPLNITIDGYELNFSKDVTNYTLLIGDETSLNIVTNRDPSKVVIAGNRDLKNGSIITISITEDTTVTYVINIKKKGNSTIYFIIVISFLLLLNIIRILAKNKKH